MRESYPALMDTLQGPLRLEELGIVDRQALDGAWADFLRTGANDLKIPIFLTLQVELWLRGREDPNPAIDYSEEGTAVVVRH